MYFIFMLYLTYYINIVSRSFSHVNTSTKYSPKTASSFSEIKLIWILSAYFSAANRSKSDLK